MSSGLCLRLAWLWLVMRAAEESRGEMFTSVTSVTLALKSERQLLHSLQTYIDLETQRHEDMKRFYSKVSDFHTAMQDELTRAMTNPLVAFTLIKRLQSEWEKLVYNDEAEENLQALRSGYQTMESSLPKREDLRGAARALMRLQDVYSLQVEGLVRGQFLRISSGNRVDIYTPSVSIPLSGDDCFMVGKVAYDVEDFYHSVQWFEEAVRLFRGSDWSPENEGSLETALDHLAFAHFKTGNIFSALSLSQELLNHEPTNQRLLLNLEKYEEILVNNSTIRSSGSVLKRPSTTYLRTRDTYERLCQTQGAQPTFYENPRLFCDYFTNDSPGLLLQPAKRELVSEQPYVVLYHDFVTDDEAQNIRDSAMPGLRRSVVASGVKQASAEYRISKSAWLKDSAHPTISKLDQRITLLTGLNVQLPYGEHLQVVNYGIGGHYEPHFDHATSTSSPVYRLNSGNRMATFMIYLSSVEAGGSTAFIYANFSVPVVKNSAIFWWNLHRNGQGNGDTLHAGCPVLIGDKWGVPSALQHRPRGVTEGGSASTKSDPCLGADGAEKRSQPACLIIYGSGGKSTVGRRLESCREASLHFRAFTLLGRHM